MSGTLYLVATPIGNLGDLSPRAVEILSSVDLIACEDTRHSLKLLNHYQISNKLVSYHEHNERERTDELIARLQSGDSVALVSDAGTPGINDPGQIVVQAAAAADIRVISVPGPVAYVNAVIISGLPTDSIFFGGFLPSRKGERRRRLETVRDIPATLAFYESPHRIAASLVDCLEVLGDRKAAAARELTKVHEAVLRGKLGELVEKFSGASPKGEFVLVIDRAGDEAAAPPDSEISELVAELERSGLDPRSAMKKAARQLGITRSEAYRRLHGSG